MHMCQKGTGAELSRIPARERPGCFSSVYPWGFMVSQPLPVLRHILWCPSRSKSVDFFLFFFFLSSIIIEKHNSPLLKWILMYISIVKEENLFIYSRDLNSQTDKWTKVVILLAIHTGKRQQFLSWKSQQIWSVYCECSSQDGFLSRKTMGFTLKLHPERRKMNLKPVLTGDN